MEVLTCLAEKNEDALRALPFCIPENTMERLLSLVRIYGPIKEVLQNNGWMRDLDAYSELCRLTDTICSLELDHHVNLDFSIIGSRNYYNGLVFRGYIADVPAVVLSGGQYDNLVKKMHKAAGGIGFAVYLNELDRLSGTPETYDYDTVMLYDDDSSQNVLAAAAQLREEAEQVFVTKSMPENAVCRKVYRLQNGRLSEFG